jgi:RHS repeat-associated protein
MASTQITQRCTYRYDPLDRLINQTQPDTPTHQRFYCKSRLATEIQGATKHSIIQHDDLLLAQQQREGDALDTTLLITDLQRSVLHTLKKATQPQPIAYSPYGHRPAFNGLLSLLGFNGERADPVTGYYLLGNGYRAFNPVLMRFNSPDSWSPFGEGGLNSYMYCEGDPVNNGDSTGRMSLSFLFQALPFMPTRNTTSVTNNLVSVAPTLTPAQRLPIMGSTQTVLPNSRGLNVTTPRAVVTPQPIQNTTKVPGNFSTSKSISAEPINYIGYDHSLTRDALNIYSTPTPVNSTHRSTNASSWRRIDTTPINFTETQNTKPINLTKTPPPPLDSHKKSANKIRWDDHDVLF